MTPRLKNDIRNICTQEFSPLKNELEQAVVHMMQNTRFVKHTYQRNLYQWIKEQRP